MSVAEEAERVMEDAARARVLMRVAREAAAERREAEEWLFEHALDDLDGRVEALLERDREQRDFGLRREAPKGDGEDVEAPFRVELKRYVRTESIGFEGALQLKTADAVMGPWEMVGLLYDLETTEIGVVVKRLERLGERVELGC